MNAISGFSMVHKSDLKVHLSKRECSCLDGKIITIRVVVPLNPWQADSH